MGQHSKVLVSRTTRPGDSGNLPQTLYLISSQNEVPAIELGQVSRPSSRQELLNDPAALADERLTAAARRAIGRLTIDHGTRLLRPVGSAERSIPLHLVESADDTWPDMWIGATTQDGGSEHLDRADIAIAIPRGHDRLHRINIGLPGFASAVAVTTRTEFKRVAEVGTAADWQAIGKESERSTVGELVSAYNALTRQYVAAPLAQFVSMEA